MPLTTVRLRILRWSRPSQSAACSPCVPPKSPSDRRPRSWPSCRCGSNRRNRPSPRAGVECDRADGRHHPVRLHIARGPQQPAQQPGAALRGDPRPGRTRRPGGRRDPMLPLAPPSPPAAPAPPRPAFARSSSAPASLRHRLVARTLSWRRTVPQEVRRRQARRAASRARPASQVRNRRPVEQSSASPWRRLRPRSARRAAPASSDRRCRRRHPSAQ